MTVDKIQFEKCFEKIEDKTLQKNINKVLDYICSKRKGFLEKPSAKKHHHAYENGLAIHTLEVIDNAIFLNKSFGKPYPEDEIILASFLHDLGKLYVYRFTDRGIDAMRTPVSEEALSLRLAYKFGIKPSIDVIGAVEFAHGGWSNLAKNKYIQPTSLYAIIHSADLLSANFGGVVENELDKT